MDLDDRWRPVQQHVPQPYRVGTDAASTPTEQRWRWRDVDVRLDRYGPTSPAPTLLVLHGGGGNGRLVGPLAVAAARAGHAAVCPDLPGYGGSAVPDRGGLRYPDWVDCATDLAAALAARGPLVVAGLSMGGLLAYDVAARLPVGSVGAVVATSLLDPRDPLVRRRIARWSWIDGVGAALLPRAASAVPALDRVLVPMPWVAPLRAVANDPALAALVADDPTAGGTRVPVGWLRTFLGSAPAVEPEEFDACPVVLAHPAADAWTPVELSLRFLHRLPPHLREVVLLERAGHLPVEQPGLDQLARVLREQLAAAAPRR